MIVKRVSNKYFLQLKKKEKTLNFIEEAILSFVANYLLYYC